MVTAVGMSERLGPRTFGKKEELVFLGREIGEQRNYCEKVAAEIDDEVRAIIDQGFTRAKEALTAHRDVLDRLAALLVEKETIEHEEFEALFEGILPPRTGGPTPKKVDADRRRRRSDRPRARHRGGWSPAATGPRATARLDPPLHTEGPPAMAGLRSFSPCR